MDPAKCVSRAGGVAVAVGLGVAIACPGVAFAEPSDSTASVSADSPSATGSTSGSPSDPAASTGSASPSDSTDPPSGIARSSVGAHTDSTSSTGDITAPDTNAEPDDDQAPVTTAPEPTEPAPTPPEQAETPAADEPAAGSDTPVTPSSARGSHHTPNPAPTAAAPDPSPILDDTNAVDRPADTEVAHLHTTVSATTASTVAAAPATAMAVPLVPTAQATPAAPVSVVTGLVSGLLAWVGLGPGLTNAPPTPVASPALWGLLAWVRREVERTLFNQTPTTAYNPAENSQSVDGVIIGDLNAVDADGDPLSFTVTQVPQNGSVVVNPDGTFVYTPSAQLAATGGTDVFTVKVVDQGAHFHGLAGLFQPDFGHSTTATVAVIVEPMSIAVGNGPSGVAVSPDGSTVYVTNSGDLSDGGNTVSVIDTATKTVIATITVGDNPANVAVTPDGATAYVTNLGDGTVSVIDTATNMVTTTTTITVGDLPDGVAVSPDGSTVYVTNAADDTVSVIDTATNMVTTTVTVGENPRHLAVSPDGARVYVTNADDGTVSVIDTATNIVATITVGELPLGVAVSPDGSRVYVTNAADDTVSVIDTATNVVTTITVGDFPIGVAVSPGGTTVYVTNSGGGLNGSVSVIDTATNAVIATYTVGDGPNNVAVSPDGTTAYVTNHGDDTVSVIVLSALQSSLVAVQDLSADLDSSVMLASQVSVESDPVSGLRGLLGWVAQQIQRTFFNQTPTTAYNPAENNQAAHGVVTGDLRAVDADGDPLSFTVTQGPQNGSVVVNPDGTFTYTPSPQLAATGGTDVFTVKVEDQGFHLHGLSGLVNFISFGLIGDPGHSATATVGVTVEPINTVIATVPAGDGPFKVAVSPDGTRAYVTNANSDTVSVIRL